MLSLFFDPTMRPDAPAIIALADRDEFSVGHDFGGNAANRSSQNSWLELLASGLAFDLSGLAPGPALAPGQFGHRFDLPNSFEPEGFDALALVPEPHLAEGEALLPVVRSELWLATRLCALPGISAVGWAPARSLGSPSHFVGIVRRWLEGGVFPALGLTALGEARDGGLHSEGLAFFTGQELRIEPELAFDRAAAERLALWLIDDLVGRKKIARAERITGPAGARLRIGPSENGRFVRVRPDRG